VWYKILSKIFRTENVWGYEKRGMNDETEDKRIFVEKYIEKLSV